MNNLTETKTKRSHPRRKRLSSSQRKEKREALIRIYGRECWHCRKELSDKEITLDHLVPVGEGGSDHLANLRLACYPCNYSRHHNPPNPKFPPGFPRPRFFFGQWVNYHSMSGSVRDKVVIHTFEGFVTGMVYQHYDDIPQWRYQLSGTHEGGSGFHIITEAAPEYTLAPIVRKPLPPEQLQRISQLQPEPQPVIVAEEYGEEISLEVRGYTCLVRRVDDGWLSLIDKRGIGNPVLICKASPTLMEALSKAVRQALRMAPSSAMGSLLNDWYKWGHLSKAEYQKLHCSFHGGLKY